jgi:thiol:disulfide interchange protein
VSKAANPKPTTGDSGLADVRHGFAPAATRSADDSDGPALSEIAAQLVDDIKATAASEIALLQARASLAGDGARRAAMWGAIAGGTVLIALLAMVFGLILALAPHTSPVLATLIVGGVLVLFATFAAWRAKRGAGDIRAALTERGDDVHWDDEA